MKLIQSWIWQSIYNIENKLKELNISESDKIIILNLRDKNYLNKIYPQKDFNYKSQNVDIKIILKQ